ncbi:T9SS type A sorting domain-containing protein [Polaribacter sp. R77954]|uniref:T9SS type A sorting domain-containing protein n=1 Tax=Polaribacter sp. R77954 TaxID=3093870 RepID=UPI0037CC4843
MKKKLLFTLLFLSTIGCFSQQKTIAELSAVPNPFTSSTKITFNADSKSSVVFTVKNVLGKTVHTQKIEAVKGKNSIPFYKGNLSTGIYIYTLQDKKHFTSKRFVIQ